MKQIFKNNVPYSSAVVCKSGRTCLQQETGGKHRKNPVFIRVCESCFEPRFKCTLNDSEGKELTFEAESHSEAIDWVDALQPQILPSSLWNCSLSPVLSPIIPKSPFMPTLQETDEDDWSYKYMERRLLGSRLEIESKKNCWLYLLHLLYKYMQLSTSEKLPSPASSTPREVESSVGWFVESIQKADLLWTMAVFVIPIQNGTSLIALPNKR